MLCISTCCTWVTEEIKGKVYIVLESKSKLAAKVSSPFRSKKVGNTKAGDQKVRSTKYFSGENFETFDWFYFIFLRYGFGRKGYMFFFIYIGQKGSWPNRERHESGYNHYQRWPRGLLWRASLSRWPWLLGPSLAPHGSGLRASGTERRADVVLETRKKHRRRRTRVIRAPKADRE